MRHILSEIIIKNYSFGTNFFKKIKFLNLLFWEKIAIFEICFKILTLKIFSCYGFEIFKKFFFVDNEEKYEDFQNIF